jgi:hypothetical protein
MASPVQAWPVIETWVCAVAPLAPFHAVMLPVIDAKMNWAGVGAGVGVGEGGGVITKSDVPFLTTPVGRPPGMVIVCGLVFSTTGAPPTSPFINCVVLVPALETQKGLAELAAIPHGLTSSGSSTGANPGMSESRFVCR